jgi:hypothetical protein
MKKLTALAAALMIGSVAALAGMDTPAKDGKAKAECKDKACCKDKGACCKDGKKDEKKG